KVSNPNRLRWLSLLSNHGIRCAVCVRPVCALSRTSRPHGPRFHRGQPAHTELTDFEKRPCSQPAPWPRRGEQRASASACAVTNTTETPTGVNGENPAGLRHSQRRTHGLDGGATPLDITTTGPRATGLPVLLSTWCPCVGEAVPVRARRVQINC